MNIKAPQNLLEMLTYRRPHLSASEDEFITKFILPYVDDIDQAGNLYVTVGPSDPTILFSSHTDSVHRTPGIQQIEVTEDGWIFKPTNSIECLGADCATGIWLMLEMIQAEVPGLYIFHRGEESGGIGSSYIAKHEKARLANIEAAIAFDRYGYRSIITHQFGERCCSDEFARSLGDVLEFDIEDHTPWWQLDDGGTFTDTAMYTHLIPECTNISVGYFDQHMPKEAQNYEFLLLLRATLIRADWSKLVIKRDPEETYYTSASTKRYLDDYAGWSKYFDDYPTYSGANSELEDLVDFCTKHPHVAARTLLDTGYRVDDLVQDLNTYAA